MLMRSGEFGATATVGAAPLPPARSYPHHWVALATTLGLALLSAFLGLRDVWGDAFTIQDDARQHVFWMARFADPAAFPGDPIADYFQGLAPEGFAALYRGLGWLGLEPLQASKVLPLPLTLITAGAAYHIVTRLSGWPLAGLMAGWFMVTNLWLMDDLPSASPRAFAVPFLLLFIGAWLDRDKRHGPAFMATMILLLGWFYPQAALVAIAVAATTGLRRTRQGPWLTINFQQTRIWLPCGLAAVFALLPYLLRDTAFGPVVDAATARGMAAFLAEGRSAFFLGSPIEQYVCGGRAGALPKEWCIGAQMASPAPWYLAIMAGFLAAILLPLLPRHAVSGTRQPGAPVSATDPRQQALRGIVIRLLLASLALYAVAHLLLFNLHLPSRYTHYSLRILVDIGIVLILCHALALLWRGIPMPRISRIAGWAVALGLVALMLGGTFAARSVAGNGYTVAEPKALFTELRRAADDKSIATLLDIGANIPGITGRSTFVSGEYLMPYHRDYFSTMQARTSAMLEAVSDPGAAGLRHLLETYPIGAIVLSAAPETAAFIRARAWLRQTQPAAGIAAERLETGVVPYLRANAQACAAYRDSTVILVDADCLRRQLGDNR